MFKRSPASDGQLPLAADSDPLFASRRQAWLGILLLVCAGIGAIRFPNDHTLLEEWMARLGLPLTSGASGSGFQYGGLALTAAMLTGLVLLVRSASRRKFLIFLAAFILLNPVSMFWLYADQSTFAHGLYAVEIDLDSKACRFREEEERVRGICTFMAANRSRSTVEASAVLRPARTAYTEETSSPVIPIPLPVRLEPRSSDIVELAFDLPAGSLSAKSGSGNGLFRITLAEDGKTRTF